MKPPLLCVHIGFKHVATLMLNFEESLKQMVTLYFMELYSSEICPTRSIAENKNAIVASCWTYFTTIKHDARNHNI